MKAAEAAAWEWGTEQVAKAVEMYSDLRKWDEASAFATKHEGAAAGINVEELIRKQATYSEANDPRAAAEMYLACGETEKAITYSRSQARILLHLVDDNYQSSLFRSKNVDIYRSKKVR